MYFCTGRALNVHPGKKRWLSLKNARGDGEGWPKGFNVLIFWTKKGSSLAQRYFSRDERLL
jgi:hypothetical protein